MSRVPESCVWLPAPTGGSTAALQGSCPLLHGSCVLWEVCVCRESLSHPYQKVGCLSDTRWLLVQHWTQEPQLGGASPSLTCVTPTVLSPPPQSAPAGTCGPGVRSPWWGWGYKVMFGHLRGPFGFHLFRFYFVTWTWTVVCMER